MKRYAVAIIMVCFAVTCITSTALARRSSRHCDFHQWPRRGCKKPDNITLTGIKFSFGSSKIDHASYNILDEHADKLAKSTDLTFLIIGHTDNIGSPGANMALSKKRAAAVREYLARKGVSRNRMRIGGKGESQPIADNSSDEGRYQNRRIDIIFD